MFPKPLEIVRPTPPNPFGSQLADSQDLPLPTPSPKSLNPPRNVCFFVTKDCLRIERRFGEREAEDFDRDNDRDNDRGDDRGEPERCRFPSLSFIVATKIWVSENR